ncbi:MAG: hypothetical protein V1850_07765 [Candidatus Bathyarchaeota archaeon]
MAFQDVACEPNPSRSLRSGDGSVSRGKHRHGHVLSTVLWAEGLWPGNTDRVGWILKLRTRVADGAGGAGSRKPQFLSGHPGAGSPEQTHDVHQKSWCCAVIG